MFILKQLKDTRMKGLDKTKENEYQSRKINLVNYLLIIGSKACILSSVSFNKKTDYEECDYDEGGYFIINVELRKFLFHKKDKQKIRSIALRTLNLKLNMPIFVRLNLYLIKRF